MTAEHPFTKIERDRLETRMWNWARWVLDDGHSARNHCGSAEGRYLPPREDEERFLRSAQEPVDVADAARIEDAVTALQKPAARMYLTAWFVYRAHPVAMSRRFKVPEWQLVPRLWGLLGGVQYHLDRQHVAARKQIGYKFAHNLCTPQLA